MAWRHLGACVLLGGWSCGGATTTPTDPLRPTCADVVDMVGYDVPSANIVEVIEQSPRRWSKADVRCLVEADVPGPIVDAARREGWE